MVKKMRVILVVNLVALTCAALEMDIKEEVHDRPTEHINRPTLPSQNYRPRTAVAKNLPVLEKSRSPLRETTSTEDGEEEMLTSGRLKAIVGHARPKVFDQQQNTSEDSQTNDAERKSSVLDTMSAHIENYRLSFERGLQENTTKSISTHKYDNVDQQDRKINTRRVLTDQPGPTKMQRRTFDIWGLLGYGKDDDSKDIVKLTEEIPIPVPYTVEKKVAVPVKVEVEHPIQVEVPKPYPVTVERKVYYPVKQYIQAPYPVLKRMPYLIKMTVEKPVPVHVSKPYPIYIEKKVHYPIEKRVLYPVKIPVDRMFPVPVPYLKNVYYPVEKKVPYPVPVAVEKPVAVTVDKPYPVYIEKEVRVPTVKHVPYPVPEEIEIHDIEKDETDNGSLNNFKVEKSEINSIPTNIFENDDTSPITKHLTVEDHDPAKLQEKKDEGQGTFVLQESKEEEKRQENTTTTQVPQQVKGHEKNKTPDKVLEFGKKTKAT